MTLCNNHNNCVDTAIKKAEDLCLKQKIQFTKLRRNILNLIWQNHKPLKAYDILEQLQVKESSAKPITVYRTLDFLIENRMIHKIESQNAFLGCRHPGELHNCYFLICKECNTAEEACENDLLKNVYTNLESQGFAVEHITLEIQGICKKCNSLKNRLKDNNIEHRSNH